MGGLVRMLVSMSLDHRRACLSIRERFHLEDADFDPVFRSLERRGAGGAVLAQTCNRLEAYCWWPTASEPYGEGHGLRDPILRHRIGREICRAWTGGVEEAADELHRYAEIRSGPDTVEHLLRVAGGLESQVLGDIHILGQLRAAFHRAVEAGAIGPNLHRLFETAFRTGKRVKRETGLMATRSGVGSEAARFASSIAADEGLAVLGCGKIGRQAAARLVTSGVRDLTLVNRTPSRAERVAAELGSGRAVGLDALPALLAEARVLIVATDAPSPVLTEAMVSAACEARRPGPPLTVIDVSVPRNVEASVADLPGVELLDLDTLHPEADEVAALRCAAIPRAEALVAEASTDFLAWLELDVVRRALSPLREVLGEVCRREIAFLTGESQDSERAAERIVARVMSHPMSTFRSACARGESVKEPAATLGELFV